MDISRVIDRLKKASARKEQVRLLLGIHVHFWHAPPPRLKCMLEFQGLSDEIVRLMANIDKYCSHCSKYKYPFRRPMTKISLATHFNERLQMDFYFLWDDLFILIVDECARYKTSGRLPNREFETLMKFFLYCWFRWFGPPRQLVSDQDSTFRSTEMARLCDRYHIQRVLAGSDPQKFSSGGKHTTTGLAESHVKLHQLTMLILKEDIKNSGFEISNDELAIETSMAHNALLTFNGVTPNMCVLGIEPREHFSLENTTIENQHLSKICNTKSSCSTKNDHRQ